MVAKRRRRELERVIGKVEDIRTTIEERQEESADDGTLAEIVKDLEKVEDALEQAADKRPVDD